jgi:hypothetical protein
MQYFTGLLEGVECVKNLWAIVDIRRRTMKLH